MNRLGTMVMPFTGVYLTQARGLSIAAAGLVMALFGAGSLVSQLLAGVLADRIGRRATLSGGMLATAAAMLALGYSTTLPAILASMFLLGLVADAYRPASNALVADLISPQERPRAYGLLFWAINLGYSVGMTAGGWLAQAGFLWLFWVDAVSCVAFAVLVWRAVPETRPMGKSEAGGFGVVLRDRVMVGFTLVILGQRAAVLPDVHHAADGDDGGGGPDDRAVRPGHGAERGADRDRAAAGVRLAGPQGPGQDAGAGHRGDERRVRADGLRHHHVLAGRHDRGVDGG